MNTRTIYKLGHRFRIRRMKRFMSIMNPCATTRILDVGGTYPNWGLIPQLNAEVTLLNRTRPARSTVVPSNFKYITADGTSLPFADKSFDIVFSNSVIEHLGSFEQQKRFASELSRVGRFLWVQAPARSFPFEPHLLAPFMHYFPLMVQRKLVRYFSGWGWLSQPTRLEAECMLRELRLPTFSEYQSLFPDCRIERERFLGFTKSFIAIRKGLS